MTTTRDLSGHAVELAAVAAAVASGGPGVTALRASSIALMTLIARFSNAPVATSDSKWLASVDADGCIAVGPGLQLIVDGSVAAPRVVHAVVGERSLMVLPLGADIRVRLIDGEEVITESTFPPIGRGTDHLDTNAAIERATERASRALANRSSDPIDGPDPAPLEDSASDLGAGSTAGGIASGRGLDTRSIAAGAAIAATGVAAAAISRRRSKASWAATHIIPDDGLDSRTAPDPALAADVRLGAGLQVRLLKRSGDWAQIDASNGWTGWVDGRLLVDQTGN